MVSEINEFMIPVPNTPESAMANSTSCTMPPLLIEAELASGELVVACNRPLRGERAYYLISPAQAQPPVLGAFARWLQGMAAAAGGVPPVVGADGKG